ncbi:MAG TPA: hypothetical protein DEF00_03710 [Candidatus Taylorbacteria bacterium]|nr:hypothetical protein [Candidatus Taylorbacteria bacterium]
MKKNLFISSTGLKLIAMLTMAVDHIGILFFPGELLWRVVGRISFPIFALLIAEGFEKTSNVRNYFFRLLAFAAVSQIPYSLFLQTANITSNKLNIFFTLSAGLLSLMLLKRLPRVYAFLGIGSIAVLAEYFSFSYGVYGVLTVLASSLFLRLRNAGSLLLSVLHILSTAGAFIFGNLSLQIYATLSVPILTLYNRERGRELHRLFLYGFYPIHLLILSLIWYLFR